MIIHINVYYSILKNEELQFISYKLEIIYEKSRILAIIFKLL